MEHLCQDAGILYGEVSSQPREGALSGKARKVFRSNVDLSWKFLPAAGTNAAFDFTVQRAYPGGSSKPRYANCLALDSGAMPPITQKPKDIPSRCPSLLSDEGLKHSRPIFGSRHKTAPGIRDR
jgi:hypothetical protein